MPAHELNNTVYELLKGTVSLKETITERNGLSLVPSSLNLSGAEIEFSGLAGREFFLKDFLDRTTLEQLQAVDFIANSIFKSYEQANDQYYKTLRGRIAEDKHLYFNS